jgi:hypothetical protein
VVIAPGHRSRHHAYYPDPLAIRPIATLSVERLAAASAFDAVFGQSFGTFIGDGIQIARRRVFVQVTLSRFDRTGQRAFVTGDEDFRPDTPLTVTITPVEIIAGCRMPREFRSRRQLSPPSPRILSPGRMPIARISPEPGFWIES